MKIIHLVNKSSKFFYVQQLNSLNEIHLYGFSKQNNVLEHGLFTTGVWKTKKL